MVDCSAEEACVNMCVSIQQIVLNLGKHRTTEKRRNFWKLFYELKEKESTVLLSFQWASEER